jgi:lantibiotic modifying enzyme
MLEDNISKKHSFFFLKYFIFKKGVIRIRISEKNRQHNGKKKKSTKGQASIYEGVIQKVVNRKENNAMKLCQMCTISILTNERTYKNIYGYALSSPESVLFHILIVVLPNILKDLMKMNMAKYSSLDTVEYITIIPIIIKCLIWP